MAHNIQCRSQWERESVTRHCSWLCSVHKDHHYLSPPKSGLLMPVTVCPNQRPQHNQRWFSTGTHTLTETNKQTVMVPTRRMQQHQRERWHWMYVRHFCVCVCILSTDNIGVSKLWQTKNNTNNNVDLQVIHYDRTQREPERESDKQVVYREITV